MSALDLRESLVRGHHEVLLSQSETLLVGDYLLHSWSSACERDSVPVMRSLVSKESPSQCPSYTPGRSKP